MLVRQIRFAAVLLLLYSSVLANELDYFFWPFTHQVFPAAGQPLGDMRPLYLFATEPHLHGGFDVTETGSVACWPTWRTFEALFVDYIGMGHKAVIQHGYDCHPHPDSEVFAPYAHGSAYLHGANWPAIREGYAYFEETLQPVYEATSWWNYHLHFEVRIGLSVHAFEERINPGHIYSLKPSDINRPAIDSFYVNYADAAPHGVDVKRWDFLNHQFNYFDKFSGYDWARMIMPDETPEDDLDDPHFVIEDFDSWRVYFLSRIKDKISEGETYNAAPYAIGVYLDTALNDASDGKPTSGDVPWYVLKFDTIYAACYHQEEWVYHPDPPLVSGFGAKQYYMFYPIGGSAPHCIKVDGDKLKTEFLAEGQHRIRIYTKDLNGNSKTGDVHFYALNDPEGLVDYCRGMEGVGE
jgi:hypothetical protein